MTATITPAARPFYGWRVVAAAFVLALFGWGFGFYGPPVFLHAIHESRGWPISVISAAMTCHYLVGALTVACLPSLHARFSIATVTLVAGLCLGFGFFGWAVAAEPWQLFLATIASGIGWAATSSAGINAIVAPWFERKRVAALGMAYNGASIGGLVFSPLWVALIAWLTFPIAVGSTAVVMMVIVGLMSVLVFSRTPQSMHQAVDGDTPDDPPRQSVTAPWARPLPGRDLRRNRQWQTLTAAMALSLFAQMGLVSHLFSMLVPALGDKPAGILMGAATGLAMAGRMVLPVIMPKGTDRRLAAACNYSMQIVGTFCLWAANGTSVPQLIVGTLLFGAGIGNSTSLPPLIAQVEFTRSDVQRAIALMIATTQAIYAFSPATLGVLRDISMAHGAGPGAAPVLFVLVGAMQILAMLMMLAGRRTA
ncbi:MAG: MFS transporter [Hyphomicrobiaceae bacterium]